MPMPACLHADCEDTCSGEAQQQLYCSCQPLPFQVFECFSPKRTEKLCISLNRETQIRCNIISFMPTGPGSKQKPIPFLRTWRQTGMRKKSAQVTVHPSDYKKPSFIFPFLNDSNSLSLYGSLTATQAIQCREHGEKEGKR